MAIGSANPPLALIAGPTASGKSALALALAERTGGVIVNADSAQVYRDLPVLSAAPTAGELSRAQHRLYGYQDGAEPCSAADWADRARAEIADIHARELMPILCGGTGLYLRTLLEGIAPVPEIDPEIRRRVREASVDENRESLWELDPEAADRLKPADTARISRALEVVLSTGRTLAQWQERREGGIGEKVRLRPLVLLPPRDWLYARCDERFARMVDQGAVDEVKALLARKLNPNLPVMRGIGVREIAAFLEGDVTLDDAIAAGQQATRRYAKRQYTWFAHQPPEEWARYRDIPVPVRAELVEALSFLQSAGKGSPSTGSGRTEA
jgi:tRNA dimethylallyltransferase